MDDLYHRRSHAGPPRYNAGVYTPSREEFVAAAARGNLIPVYRELLADGDTPVSAYAALGVLHPEARVEAFYFAVERFVVPRLTRLGLDGDLAWKTRYRSGQVRSLAR